MVAYISWFNQTRTAAVREGVTIEGLVHKASPVKSESGKDWRRGECPKCGSGNGFVFRSHTDGNVYILFCQACDSYSWKRIGNNNNQQQIEDKCRALTSRGNRCKCDAVEGGLCKIHNDMRAEGKEIRLVAISNTDE